MLRFCMMRSSAEMFDYVEAVIDSSYASKMTAHVGYFLPIIGLNYAVKHGCDGYI